MCPRSNFSPAGDVSPLILKNVAALPIDLLSVDKPEKLGRFVH
jgi:hypothetical protein